MNQDANQIAEYRVADATGSAQQHIWYVVTLAIDIDGNLTVTPVQEFQDGTQTTIL